MTQAEALLAKRRELKRSSETRFLDVDPNVIKSRVTGLIEKLYWSNNERMALKLESLVSSLPSSSPTIWKTLYVITEVSNRPTSHYKIELSLPSITISDTTTNTLPEDDLVELEPNETENLESDSSDDYYDEDSEPESEGTSCEAIADSINNINSEGILEEILEPEIFENDSIVIPYGSKLVDTTITLSSSCDKLYHSPKQQSLQYAWDKCMANNVMSSTRTIKLVSESQLVSCLIYMIQGHESELFTYSSSSWQIRNSNALSLGHITTNMTHSIIQWFITNVANKLKRITTVSNSNSNSITSEAFINAISEELQDWKNKIFQKRYTLLSLKAECRKSVVKFSDTCLSLLLSSSTTTTTFLSQLYQHTLDSTNSVILWKRIFKKTTVWYYKKLISWCNNGTLLNDPYHEFFIQPCSSSTTTTTNILQRLYPCEIKISSDDDRYFGNVCSYIMTIHSDTNTGTLPYNYYDNDSNNNYSSMEDNIINTGISASVTKELLSRRNSNNIGESLMSVLLPDLESSFDVLASVYLLSSSRDILNFKRQSKYLCDSDSPSVLECNLLLIDNNLDSDIILLLSDKKEIKINLSWPFDTILNSTRFNTVRRLCWKVEYVQDVVVKYQLLLKKSASSSSTTRTFVQVFQMLHFVQSVYADIMSHISGFHRMIKESFKSRVSLRDWSDLYENAVNTLWEQCFLHSRQKTIMHYLQHLLDLILEYASSSSDRNNKDYSDQVLVKYQQSYSNLVRILQSLYARGNTRTNRLESLVTRLAIEV